MDLFNREIISYSISLNPNLEQEREMLNCLFDKLPADSTPVFHSDQGWQYQHAEYQHLLRKHNIIQNMSRKGNYRLYSIEVEGEPDKTYIVITKDIINKDDNIEWKALDNERWYVRKV